MIHTISAAIKFNTVYKCVRCGRRQVGETKRIEFIGTSAADLKQFIDNQPQTSHQMPIGWGFNGEFTCGCPKK